MAGLLVGFEVCTKPKGGHRELALQPCWSLVPAASYTVLGKLAVYQFHG